MKTKTRKKIGQNGQAKSAETRERILNCAEELFIERGFDGVSVKDVATSADCSKALVFFHFRNKQELFGSVLDRYYSGQAEALMAAVGAGNGIRDRIHAGIDAYLDFIESRPGYPRLIQGVICSNSSGMDKIVQHMAPLYQWGRSVFGDILPDRGPHSHRQFFVSIFGLIINYYTYSPVIEQLWQQDIMDDNALSERREHVHAVVDRMIDEFVSAGK